MKGVARDIEIFGHAMGGLAKTKTARGRFGNARAVWLPGPPTCGGPAFGFQWPRVKASVRPSAALCIASSITVITSMASCGLTGNGRPSRIDAASAR